MTKRILSAVLAALMLLALCVPALAAEDEIEVTWFSLPYTEGLWLPNTVYDEYLDVFRLMYDSPEGDGYIYPMIDRRSGQEVSFREYDWIRVFSEGLARVEKDEKYGFIDETGQVVVPLEYDYAGNFSEGLAAVAKKDSNGDLKWGYIDETGQVVVPLEYDYANAFSEGLAQVTKKDSDGNEKCGFIDEAGQEVIPLEWIIAESFAEGLAYVVKRDSDGLKRGFIDKTGQLVISLEYYNSSAISFSDGLAAVVKEDSDGPKYGYIDKAGQLAIPLEYDVGNFFCNGHTLVRKDGKWGFIDKTGQMVCPLDMETNGGIVFISGGRFCVFNEGDSMGVFENPYWDGENTVDEDTVQTLRELLLQ